MMAATNMASLPVTFAKESILRHKMDRAQSYFLIDCLLGKHVLSGHVNMSNANI